MRPLPVVITSVPSNVERVNRLVKYCYDLDGTKVRVFAVDDSNFTPRYPNNAFACKQGHSLHTAAQHMEGKSFIWLEADASPLQSGWARQVTEAYKEGGKPFLLSSDSRPPHDLVGGIGVYSGETSWLIPENQPECGWDLWMIKHLKPLIHFSPIIQHSYGHYIGNHAQPHRFPRDKFMLRDDAVIFHRDLHQDLILPEHEAEPIEKRDEVIFRHGGDLGDIIAALPILRAKGGGHVILFHDPAAPIGQRGRESLEGARYEAIKPLLEAQPYVFSVKWGEGVDTSNFRTVMRPRNESLVERQARHVGLWPLDLSPWLYVPCQPHNRVVVARSGRYPNPYGFPWKEIGAAYRDRLLFVGLESEHAAFEALIGRKVERAQTENLYQVAQIIAGSTLMYCNQSAPLWIALGLGSRVIVEGFAEAPNSEIMTNPRSFFAYSESNLDTIRRSLARIT